MTELEIYLSEYSQAKRELNKLLIDLEVAKRAYEDKYDDLFNGQDYARIRAKGRSHMSPTERTAILIVDHYSMEVEQIEGRISRARMKMEAIENLIEKSQLTQRERNFVKIRYLEGRSAESTCQRMFISSTTKDRIRKSALDKIGQKK